MVGVVPLEGLVAETNDITNLDVFSHCVSQTTAVAGIDSYINDNGETVFNQLVNVSIGAGGAEKGCEEVKDTVLLSIVGSTNKMFSILQ
jgi:hypothetical protein